MSVTDELNRALGHIYPRAGFNGKLYYGATGVDVTATVSNDLHVGGTDGGFTNRYDNRADGMIGNRYLIGFAKGGPERPTGCILKLDDGRQFEVQEPVDENAGEIIYGAAQI